MADDDDRIDLDVLDEHEYAAFFLHLLSHAFRGEGQSIAGHCQDVIPTPENIGHLLAGMAHGVEVTAALVHKHLRATRPDVVTDDVPAAELRFGLVADPVDQLVVEAGGFPGEDAVRHVQDLAEVPYGIRLAAQITTAAISQDDTAVLALVTSVVDRYLDELDGPEPAEQYESLWTVSAMVDCLCGWVGTQRAAFAEMRVASDEEMSEFENQFHE